MSAYPPIFEAVWLYAYDGAAFECRVLGQRGGNLLLLPPSEPGLVDGATYDLIWQAADDLYRQRIRLELSADPDAPMVLVPDSSVLRADRRENVRVTVDADVALSPVTGGFTVSGRSVDLSEGGVKVEIPAKLVGGFLPGEIVYVDFELRGVGYRVEGEVSRVAPAGEGLAEVVVGFGPSAIGEMRRAILVETVFA